MALSSGKFAAVPVLYYMNGLFIYFEVVCTDIECRIDVCCIMVYYCLFDGATSSFARDR